VLHFLECSQPGIINSITGIFNANLNVVLSSFIKLSLVLVQFKFHHLSSFIG